jgi:flagellar basal-body rod protein FlgG
MNHAFEIAGVGLATQQRALDVIANNIANINTLGFKRSDMRFVELIASVHDTQNPSAQLGGAPALAGVSARPMVMIDAQGEIERTGRALDIAIQGEGFIEVMGPRGQVLLWRGGSLTVQEDGLLATTEGMALRSMITLPREATELEIGADGIVRARLASNEEAVELGQLTLVRVDDPQSLERLDGGLYRLADNALAYEMTPGSEGAGEIVQGGVERSNVEITDEMVRLMLVQRAYAANAQIVQAADQLMAIANNLRK